MDDWDEDLHGGIGLGEGESEGPGFIVAVLFCVAFMGLVYAAVRALG